MATAKMPAKWILFMILSELLLLSPLLLAFNAPDGPAGVVVAAQKKCVNRNILAIRSL